MKASQIEKAVEEVLSRPEFEVRDLRTPGSGMDFGWLGDLIELTRTTPSLKWLIIGAMCGLVLWVLWRLASVLYNEYNSRLGERADGESFRRATEDRASGPAEALKLAGDYLSAGNLYQALWITHRTLLAVLDQRRLIDFHKSRTNRYYLRRFDRRNELYPILNDSTELYDRLIYAHKEVSSESVGNLLNRVADLALHKRSHGGRAF